MSASLVGSEMCIRDSRAISASLARRSCSVSQPSSDVPRATVSGARVGAVSYTHLTLPTICSV
eukprot:14683434-Alexandrium_andersonii.AAC.1